MVKISMDPFVYKYQPELYEDWCRGINLTPHPEDIQLKKLNQPILGNSFAKKTLSTNLNSNKSKFRSTYYPCTEQGARPRSCDILVAEYLFGCPDEN
jgi:hypothetical protein